MLTQKKSNRSKLALGPEEAVGIVPRKNPQGLYRGKTQPQGGKYPELIWNTTRKVPEMKQ